MSLYHVLLVTCLYFSSTTYCASQQKPSDTQQKKKKKKKQVVLSAPAAAGAGAGAARAAERDVPERYQAQVPVEQQAARQVRQRILIPVGQPALAISALTKAVNELDDQKIADILLNNNINPADLKNLLENAIPALRKKDKKSVNKRKIDAIKQQLSAALDSPALPEETADAASAEAAPESGHTEAHKELIKALEEYETQQRLREIKFGPIPPVLTEAQQKAQYQKDINERVIKIVNDNNNAGGDLLALDLKEADNATQAQALMTAISYANQLFVEVILNNSSVDLLKKYALNKGVRPETPYEFSQSVLRFADTAKRINAASNITRMVGEAEMEQRKRATQQSAAQDQKEAVAEIQKDVAPAAGAGQTEVFYYSDNKNDYDQLLVAAVKNLLAYEVDDILQYNLAIKSTIAMLLEEIPHLQEQHSSFKDYDTLEAIKNMLSNALPNAPEDAANTSIKLPSKATGQEAHAKKVEYANTLLLSAGNDLNKIKAAISLGASIENQERELIYIIENRMDDKVDPFLEGKIDLNKKKHNGKTILEIAQDALAKAANMSSFDRGPAARNLNKIQAAIAQQEQQK